MYFSAKNYGWDDEDTKTLNWTMNINQSFDELSDTSTLVGDDEVIDEGAIEKEAIEVPVEKKDGIENNSNTANCDTRIKVPLEEDEDKDDDDHDEALITDDLEHVHMEPDRMSMERLSVFENHNSIINTTGEITNPSKVQNEKRY